MHMYNPPILARRYARMCSRRWGSPWPRLRASLA